MPDSLKQLETMLEAHDKLTKGMVSLKDFEEFVKVFTGLVKKLTEQLDKELSSISAEMKNHRQVIRSFFAETEKLIDERKEIIQSMKGTDAETQAEIKTLRDTFTDQIDKLKDLIPKMPDLSFVDRELRKLEAKIPKIPKEITAEEIVKKVKSVGLDLEISDIKELKDEIEALRKEIRSTPRGVVRPIFGGRTGGVAFEKLNSQLNGVTKTFVIPNLRDVVAIMGTSFPNVFASVDDYTVGNKSITFTDAIDAGTTLASGQTIVVIYNQLHYT